MSIVDYINAHSSTICNQFLYELRYKLENKNNQFEMRHRMADEINACDQIEKACKKKRWYAVAIQIHEVVYGCKSIFPYSRKGVNKRDLRLC